MNFAEGLRGLGFSDADISFLHRDYAFESMCKDTKNLRNNGRIRVKFDKWLVHIPFLCYLTILLISAEGAVYGGY